MPGLSAIFDWDADGFCLLHEPFPASNAWSYIRLARAETDDWGQGTSMHMSLSLPLEAAAALLIADAQYSGHIHKLLTKLMPEDTLRPHSQRVLRCICSD